MKYVVQFTLPYVQRVMVGIEAASADEAIKKAEALSDQGDIMQASEEVPLLFDDCEGATAWSVLPSSRNWRKMSPGRNRTGTSTHVTSTRRRFRWESC